VWNQHLHKGLTELGYRQSKIDPCLYYRNGLIMIIYRDDCIMVSDNSSTLENAIMEMSKKFEITDEGEIDEYLGVKVQHNDDGSFELSQPLLIEQILTTLGFNSPTKPRQHQHYLVRSYKEMKMAQTMRQCGIIGES